MCLLHDILGLVLVLNNGPRHALETLIVSLNNQMI
jgi:hypothetical protein